MTTTATVDIDNLLSIPKYAKLRGVPTRRIRALIGLGVIVPTSISDKDFVDVEKYKDLDVEARVKREASIADLVNENVVLKQRIKKLENVVFVRSENGRGPAKNKD